jgi:hypothetical protein
MCTHFNTLVLAQEATERVFGALDERYGADWVDRVNVGDTPHLLPWQLIDDLEGMPGRANSILATFDRDRRLAFLAFNEMYTMALHAAIVARRNELAQERDAAAGRVADEVTAPPAPAVEPVKVAVA